MKAVSLGDVSLHPVTEASLRIGQEMTKQALSRHGCLHCADNPLVMFYPWMEKMKLFWPIIQLLVSKPNISAREE